MSKTCQEIIELMNLYLDGRLSGGQYQELAKHLAECEHCSKRMKYLRVISSEVRADRPAMPNDLHNSIMSYIAKANQPAPERKVFSFAKWKKPLAICAAVLVLVIVAPVAWTLSNPVDATIPNQATAGNWFSQLIQSLNPFDKGDADEDAGSDADKPDGSNQGDDGTSATDPGQSGFGEGDKSQAAYTVPALKTNERFANYIVATGTVLDISTHFDLRSVQVNPEDGSIYVYLSNDAGSLAQVYTSIRHMGLTLQLNVRGLPEMDEAAPEILFLIFPK